MCNVINSNIFINWLVFVLIKYIYKYASKEIFSLIDDEKRQIEGIELIASENFTNDQVMSATGSILTNKYAEVIQVNVITVVVRL